MGIEEGAVPESPGPRLSLGPYDIGEALGEGGMATVWSGVHRLSGARVAIKVLSAEAAASAHVRSSFRNEVRAYAGLGHPSIVEVFDFGEVPPELAAASGGRFVERSPYLVMMYLGGGSLEPLCGKVSWWQIRHVLLHLLDALAHAHARGLIHRDIKPANALLSEDRSEVRLTDFGLVHAVEATRPGEHEGVLAGTPLFMSPEQCRRSFRDYGPWTDFYSLGLLGFALVTGKPAWSGLASASEVFEAHLRRPLPPQEPRCAVPLGLGRWLERMTAKDPADRFQRASEAGRALLALPARWSGSSDPALWTMPEEEDEIVTDPQMAARGMVELGRASFRLSTIGAGDVGVAADEATLEWQKRGRASIPTPSRWSAGTQARWTSPLVGTGLSIYWLRWIPVVGRRAERNLLWETLRAVQSFGRAQAVLISGPPGVGKSRLAEWICERGHEIGGADFLQVRHSSAGGHDEGLSDMLRSWFRVRGLDREEARERIEQVLWTHGVEDRAEAAALLDLIHPRRTADDDDTPAAATRYERHVLVRRTLARAARRRTLILWLDDVNWNLDSLEFVRHLLATQERQPAPILLVATLEPSTAATRQVEARLVSEIAASPEVQPLELGPMTRADQSRLAELLLPLEAELAAEVVDRTGGNPAFAVQLLGDLVDRGTLEAGERGFTLPVGSRVEIPDDLHAVWAHRVRQFLLGRGEADGLALELAAAYGRSFEGDEWSDLCSFAGLDPSPYLIAEPLDADLAGGGPGGWGDGWTLAHVMLRESLLRRAVEAERAEDHYLACARWLRGRSGPRRSEEIGHQLVRGGRAEEALVPLQAAAQRHVASGNLRHAEALVAELARLLEGMELEPRDSRWGNVWLLRARLASSRAQDEEFEQLAGRIEGESPGQRRDEVVDQLRLERARRARQRGEYQVARQLLEELEVVATREHDEGLLAACLAELGRLELTRGRRREAEPLLQQALIRLQHQEDEIQAGHVLIVLAELAARRLDTETSEELLGLASRFFARAAAEAGAAAAEVVRAVSARCAGDYAVAAEHYREAVARHDALGSPRARELEVALGQVLALGGQLDESRRLLESAVRRFEFAARTDRAAVAMLSLLPAHAKAGRWGDWDRCLRAGQAGLGAEPPWDDDLRDFLLCASVQARAAGQADAADRAIEVAELLGGGDGLRYASADGPWTDAFLDLERTDPSIPPEALEFEELDTVPEVELD